MIKIDFVRPNAKFGWENGQWPTAILTQGMQDTQSKHTETLHMYIHCMHIHELTHSITFYTDNDA